MIVRIPSGQENQGIRFQSVFDCDTRIAIQVRGGATITIAKEQGEINNNNPIADGLQFTLGTTSPPFYMVWKGELWYKSDTPDSAFILEIIGRVGGSSEEN